MFNNSFKYYVDLRVGCVAVRLRNKEFDEHSPGLHHDTLGVVRLWIGKCLKSSTTGFFNWTVPESTLLEATIMCEDLNSGLIYMSHNDID